MREFVDTRHCTLQLHCTTCRDFNGGRDWRAALLLRFSLPYGRADFTCPHGRPWGFQPPSRGLGDTVAKIVHAVTGIKPCGGCQKRRAALNRLMPYRSR